MIRQSDSEPSAATDLHLLLTQLTELRRAMEQSVEFDDGLDQRLSAALRGRIRDCDAQLAHVIGHLDHHRRQHESVESERHESEQRYRSLYDNNPSMYFTLSAGGVVISVNKYGAEQLGYEPADLIGRSVLPVFKPDDHEVVLRQLSLCMTNPGKLFEWEIQKIRKNGTELWVRERAQAIQDRTGQTLVLVVCEDVTARRRTEEIVRESEERWRALYEHAGIGIAQLDLNGRFVRVNPRLCETLDYSSAMLLQRTFQDLLHPDDLEPSIGCLQELLAGTRPSFSMEKRYLRSDDVWVWVDMTVSLVRAASGAPAYLIAVIQSIHARKEAEDAVRRTTHLLQTLVRASPLPIISLDCDARVTTWNPAATRLFGWTEEEVLGRELPYVPEDEASTADTLWEQGLRGEVQGPIELRRRRKDGAILNLLLWPVFVRLNDGAVSTAVGLYVDQSDLKRAEAAQLKSELRLRSFLDALDDLAFEFDENGTYLSVWTRNEENLLVPRREVVGKRLRDIFGAQEGARYLDAIRRVLATGRPEPIEYTIPINGQPRNFSAIMSRIPAFDDASATVACVVRDVTDQKQAQETLRDSEQAIRSLHEATSNPGLSHEQRIQTVLELGCRRFRLPIGVVTRLRGDEVEITHICGPLTAFSPGMRLPLRQTYCCATLESKRVVSFEHAKASGWVDHPGYETLGFECYIGTRVRGESKMHGTICFLSAEPRPTPFSEADKDFLLLMAKWIAVESDRSLAERRLERINECFLKSGGDPLENVQRLTALCGGLLEGSCALYSRLEGEFLSAVGQWQAPPEFQAVDRAEGHLCTELIRRGEADLVTIRHLPDTSYAETDPNVRLYQLQTYIGKVVSIDDEAVGSLCVVFDRDFIPTEADERLMGILAAAIGTEEQRIQAQKALRASEERFAKAFRSSPYPVIMTVLDSGKCLEVNDAALKLFGYERGEVVGRTAVALGLCADLEERETFFEKLRRENVVRNYEMSLKAKDGTIRQVLVSSEIIEVHGSTCVLTVGSDITEQKQAESALRTSELRLQRFVSEAPVGLVILDRHRRLMSANRAFCELTGYDERELIGRSYDLYTHPDDLAPNLELTDDFYRGILKEYSIEKRYLRKTGETIWVSLKATGIELPNQPGPLLLAVVQDITDQKRATEERERLSQDLHDNILQSLYAVGMQLEASALAAGKSVRKSRNHASQAIDQLNRLVNDVRHYIALLKRGGGAKMNLHQALRQLVSSFSTTGHRPPELEIKEGVLDLITTEQAEQLLNIAREALSNSVRHANATHRSVRLSSLGPAGMRMQICDDGIGFVPKLERKQGHGLANMAARAKRSAPGCG